MRVAFYTLGCKVNLYETEMMSGLFSANGFDVVDVSDEADIYIINSCTVTEASDKKTRQLIRRFKSNNPTAIIGLTGCFPQAFPESAQSLAEVDVVQGSYNRMAILKNVKQVLATGERIVDITPHKAGEQFEQMKVAKISDKHQNRRTRAFIKIEDGCDRYCSYCIIPKARGPIRSKELADIKEEVIDLVANGYCEIVLVGINLSSYGKDKGLRLIDAIELCCGIEGVKRVRLGSLEPELLLDEDLDRMSKLEQFCPQFHLSLQSGSNATLKRMNRHYTAEEYMAIVEKIRARFQNPSITTDIMVGFAGETEQEFAESLAFAQAVGFARVHVFAYSIRVGTRAADFSNQVAKVDKDSRSRLMIEATSALTAEFLQQQVGKSSEVLIETKQSEGSFIGYTKNYTRVVIDSDEDICGKVIDVLITGSDGEQCVAALKVEID